MRRKRHSEEQIIAILKQAQAGVKTAEICRQHGISEQTYYRWKAKYGGLELSEAKKLRRLEEENRQLKQPGGRTQPRQTSAPGRVVKKLLEPTGRREAVNHVIAHHHRSERKACGLIRLARSTKRYQARPRADEQALRKRLRELAAERPRFGYRRLTALLRRAGWEVNPKRVHRLYREEGLALRRKTRRKLRRDRPPSTAPQRVNERWSMDFVSDALASGRSFRNLTLVDDYTRECLAIEVDTSLGGARVRRVLERVAGERGRPEAILSDNGPEFQSRAVETWTLEAKLRQDFIEPGKPVQNAFIESFNGRLREECLNTHWFTNLADAQGKIAAWREDYNTQRPHSSLGYSDAPRVCQARVRGGGVKRDIALATESTRRDGTRQGFAAPPKKVRLRGRCPSGDSPGSLAPNPDPSHSNWTIPRGQVTCCKVALTRAAKWGGG